MDEPRLDGYDRTCKEEWNLTEGVESIFPNAVETVVKLYVYPCVLALGLLGNISFLVVVARVSSMRTITNFYLVNLAIADLIYLTVGVGEKIWRFHASPLINDDSPKGPIGCPTIGFIIDCGYNGSVLLIMAVTIERYYAICKPFWHRRIATWSRTHRIIVLTWVVSGVLAAILIPGRCIIEYACLIYPDDPMYEDFPAYYGDCSTPWPKYLVVGNVFELIPFCLALFMNSILYALIIRRLSVRIKSDISVKSDRYRFRKERNAVTRMLVISGVLFLVLYTPYHLVTILFAITAMSGADAYATLHEKVSPYWAILHTLLYVNSAINPYIYGATNARYRRALLNTFSSSRRKKEDTIYSISRKSLTTSLYN